MGILTGNRRLFTDLSMIEPSNNQTKEWRCNQPWYLNGKDKECEKYQISLIEEITGVKVDKTNKRINLITNK